MKKRITLIMSVICLLALVAVLASCGHEHAFKTEWEKDDANHWHKCDVEGDECAEVSDKAAHTFEKTSETAADCTVNGSIVETCTVCGYVKTTEVAAIGHEYSEVVIAPTCTEGGKTVVTCKRNGCDYKEEKNPTEVVPHSWIEATCASPKKCANCPLTEGEALEHEYQREVVAPTCISVGLTKVTCANCDYYAEEDKQDRLPHEYNKENPVAGVDYRVVKKPTCEDEGEGYYICKTCGNAHVKDENKIIIEPEGHGEFIETVIPPTCDLPGRTEVTCSKGCDYYVEKDEVPKNGHKYYMEDNAELGVHYNVTLDPTCTEKGERSYICTVEGCGLVATEADGKKEIEPLGHDWGVSREPWCGNDSHYEYTCQRTCRDVKCEETKTEKAETEVRHVYTIESIVEPATCVGYAQVRCINCEAVIEAYHDGEIGLPTNIHKYDVVQEMFDSTCTKNGYTVYGCSAGECNTTEIRDVKPLAAHTLSEVSEHGAVSCLVCNKSYIDITAVQESGSDKVCFGCGNDPCTCEGTSADWDGFKKPAEPTPITGGAEQTITSVGDVALSIGNGLIVINANGDGTATITVEVYNGDELVDTFELTGNLIVIDLYECPSVDKVIINTPVDATASFYKAV